LISDLNVDQLKLPLGFIKIPQLILAVIAFTAQSGWKFAVSFTCDKTKVSTTIDSFDLGTTFKKCDGIADRVFTADHSTAASFFSLVAILSIIYVLITLYVYLFKWGVYAGDERIPKVDLIITCILAIWWFLATWIWWRATNQLENETEVKTVEQRFKAADFCGKKTGDFEKCDFHSYADYATLTVSVIAGFGCLLLWASNIYFAFKETSWFGQRKPTATAMNSSGIA